MSKKVAEAILSGATDGWCWRMEPVDRSLDPEKTSRYLSRLIDSGVEKELTDFIEQLLNHTTYIPFDEFLTALRETMSRFMESIGDRPLYLLVTDKVGSESWTAAILASELRSLNIVSVIDTTPMEITDPIDILIIDDAAYSGINLTAQIDEFTWSSAERMGESRKEIVKRVKYHVVVPYASKRLAPTLASVVGQSFTIYSVHKLPLLTELMNTSHLDEWELYRRFGIEMINLPPVYFDHKVAGSMSTFYTIYLDGTVPDSSPSGHLLRSLPSREKIEELERLYAD